MGNNPGPINGPRNKDIGNASINEDFRRVEETHAR